jgi:hypothetical protein
MRGHAVTASKPRPAMSAFANRTDFSPNLRAKAMASAHESASLWRIVKRVADKLGGQFHYFFPFFA